MQCKFSICIDLICCLLRRINWARHPLSKFLFASDIINKRARDTLFFEVLMISTIQISLCDLLATKTSFPFHVCSASIPILRGLGRTNKFLPFVGLRFICICSANRFTHYSVLANGFPESVPFPYVGE